VTAVQYAKNGAVFVTQEYSNAVLQISQCANIREMVELTDGSRSGLDENELVTQLFISIGDADGTV
jgi:hypothetical protein